MSVDLTPLKADMTAWRRHIHQHPELGNREVRTAKLVAEHLTALGFELRRAGPQAISVRSVMGLKLEQLVLDAPELDIRLLANGQWRIAGMFPPIKVAHQRLIQPIALKPVAISGNPSAERGHHLADMLADDARRAFWGRNGLAYADSADLYSMPQHAADIILATRP